MCVFLVFVRYNLGPGVALELQEEASVAELKEVVGSQQGVRPEHLRVLFAGRELKSTATLQVRSEFRGQGSGCSCGQNEHQDNVTSSPPLLLLPSPPPLLLSSSCQGCDLPEQSTIHVVLPPPGSSSSRLLLLQERLAWSSEEQHSLTRLDLSSSRLPSTSSGMAVILEGSDGGGDGGGQEGAKEAREEVREEAREDALAAGLKGQ